MQVVGRIRSSYALKVHKVTSTRGEGFLFKKSSMCTTCHSFSVTSRRGLPTSRRQFYMSLSRRDVDFPRRDVNFTCLCHVATWTSHVVTSILHVSVTSRRRLPTSRRQFLPPLSRRDVDLHVATSVFTSLCHVATSPRTSRRCPVLSPRTVHFWLFTSHTPPIGTLAFLRTSLHRTCRSSHSTGRRSLHCFSTTSVHHRVTLSNWFRVIVAFTPHCTRL